MNIKETDNKYIASTYARFPINLVSGKGSIIYDSDNKEYIDLMSGIAVNTFGTADDEWVSAITAQLGKLQHTSNLYYSDPATNLAKLLCEKSGMKKVFFSNSGAEANECAIKTARKYAKEKKGENCYKIITLKNSFHGRTITTLSATGQDVFHKDFLPLTDGFIYVEPGNTEELKKVVESEEIAAIMFECVQGEGGVVPLTKEFVSEMAKIGEEKDILLIADEVQIGNGRSGKLYGYMNYDITPDIVSTAKGLGGGLPIGATLFSEKTENVLGPGDHGSTFGGNPIAAAGAISVIKRLDDEFLKTVREKSDYIFSTLSGKSGIKSVSGMGLMIGIETEKDASLVIKECMDKGVLVIKAKNKVRLLPPLNIPQHLLSKAIDIIISVCEV